MRNNDTVILGIESSCDDTSAAVLKNETILSNKISSQSVHEKYGGVVPELASRAHQKNIVPVVDAALKEAGVTLDEVDAIAFTKGPGLLGSLIVGTSFAKALSLAKKIPLIDVNHMHGHVLAHFILQEGKTAPSFPFICLTVSGGHTQLVLVRDYLEMEVMGSTIDDAAGEAFDKIGKLLGFPYPGGHLIDREAKKGDPKRFEFARPKVGGFDYSFSGLKTSVLYFLQRETRKNPDFISENLADLCASVQQTIVDLLLKNLAALADELKIDQVAIAGGVSANSALREQLQQWGAETGRAIYIPDFQYCTDNAAMIAIAGRFMYEKKLFTDQTVSAQARLKMSL